MKRFTILFLLAVASCWAQCPQGFSSIGGQCLAPPAIQAAQITLTATQINGMFATPVQIIPAQGAGTIINILKCTYNAVFGSAAFTGGGTISVFFGSSGSLAIAGVPATLLTTFAANQVTAGNTNIATTTAAVNAAATVSNQTGSFAGGTGSTMTVACQYSILTGMQ